MCYLNLSRFYIQFLITVDAIEKAWRHINPLKKNKRRRNTKFTGENVDKFTIL